MCPVDDPSTRASLRAGTRAAPRSSQAAKPPTCHTNRLQVARMPKLMHRSDPFRVRTAPAPRPAVAIIIIIIITTIKLSELESSWVNDSN